MPVLVLTADPVSLKSSWYYARVYHDETGWTYTAPSSESDACVFSLSEIPAGSIIESARFSSSSWGSGGTKYISCLEQTFSSSRDLPVEKIIPGDTIRASFFYRADGYTPGSGTSGTVTKYAGWNNITLTITYKEPLTAPLPPTEVFLSPDPAFPGQEVTLSWAGAQKGESNDIVGYTVYRSETSDGGYEPFLIISETETGGEVSFEAPSEGAFFYKVVTNGVVSNSALSSTYAKLTIDLSTTSDFVLSDTSIEAGERLMLSISNVKDSPHIITFMFGDYKIEAELAANVSTFYLETPLEWLNAIPNAVSGTMTVIVKTVGGGTKTQKITLMCPEYVVPVVGDVYVERIDGTVPSSWQMYVAGFSKALAVIQTEAEMAYSSPIVSYQIYGGDAFAEFDSVPNSMPTQFLSAGEQTITFSAIDGRGRVGSKTITIQVQPYVYPFVNEISSLRSNSEGIEDDEGLFITSSALLNYTSCEGKNSVYCAVYYRQQGAEEWTFAGKLDGLLVFGGDVALTNNYEVKYVITDSVGGSGTSLDIVTRAVREINIARGGGAWAFGGVANEKGFLKVYGKMKVVENTELQGELKVRSNAEVTGNMKVEKDLEVGGKIGFYTSFLLTTENWQGEKPYTKTVVIEGLPLNMVRPPMITPSNSADIEVSKLEDEAWANIYHVKIEDGELTFYSYKPFTQELLLHVTVI